MIVSTKTLRQLSHLLTDEQHVNACDVYSVDEWQRIGSAQTRMNAEVKL